MQWYDWLIIAVVGILFVLALGYSIKNRGCSSECKNCNMNCKECLKKIQKELKNEQ